MKTIWNLAYLTLAVVLLNACSTPNNVSTAPPTNAPINQSFSLGTGDSIEINVWENPELSTRATVRPDGKISMPLVGEITASGKTPEQLDTELTEAISKFIKNPVVSIMVLSFDSAQFQQRVRITGAVEQPTSVQWQRGITVLDLLLLAGGTTEFAAPNRSFLYRKSEEGTVTAYRVKLNDILKKGDLSTNYELSPSDILTVAERSF